jgi:DNA-binding transcriptional MerR regulator
VFKIGDFAKLSRVTVRTLRYYEEVGLLLPRQTDGWTGYRYYSADQLPRLNRILALKDLGFALDQIARLLNDDLSAAELRGMLKMRHAELESQIGEMQAQLERVEVRLIQIEMEDKMPDYDVSIKRVEPQRVAIVRDIIPNQEVIGPTFDRLFDEVIAYVENNKTGFTGPGIALWYEMSEAMENMKVGAAMPTNAPLKQGERISVEDLPGIEAASVVHHGPFATLTQAYEAAFNWIAANGYRIAGPSREVYIQYERGGDQSKYVTELQFPVEKA